MSQPSDYPLTRSELIDRGGGFPSRWHQDACQPFRRMGDYQYRLEHPYRSERVLYLQTLPYLVCACDRHMKVSPLTPCPHLRGVLVREREGPPIKDVDSDPLATASLAELRSRVRSGPDSHNAARRLLAHPDSGVDAWRTIAELSPVGPITVTLVRFRSARHDPVVRRRLRRHALWPYLLARHLIGAMEGQELTEALTEVSAEKGLEHLADVLEHNAEALSGKLTYRHLQPLLGARDRSLRTRGLRLLTACGSEVSRTPSTTSEAGR